MSTPPFEVAFERLEAILEKMNAGEVALDDALKLYEEADKLITHCSKRLADAESRIETLIKKRDGSLATESDGQPQTETLAPA